MLAGPLSTLSRLFDQRRARWALAFLSVALLLATIELWPHTPAVANTATPVPPTATPVPPTATPVPPTPTPIPPATLPINPVQGVPGTTSVTISGSNYSLGSYNIIFGSTSVGTINVTGGLWTYTFLVPASGSG